MLFRLFIDDGSCHVSGHPLAREIESKSSISQSFRFRLNMDTARNLEYLHQVEGRADCFNNLILVPPSSSESTSSNQMAVYFGGDVQNFESEMSDTSPWKLRYSLEQVAIRLAGRFPSHTILVV